MTEADSRDQHIELAQGIKWNDQGLVPAIAQDWQTGEILMMAWMNPEALALLSLIHI